MTYKSQISTKTRFFFLLSVHFVDITTLRCTSHSLWTLYLDTFTLPDILCMNESKRNQVRVNREQQKKNLLYFVFEYDSILQWDIFSKQLNNTYLCSLINYLLLLILNRRILTAIIWYYILCRVYSIDYRYLYLYRTRLNEYRYT